MKLNNDMKFHILKRLCGDFIEDFILKYKILDISKHEINLNVVSVDFSIYSLILIPFLFNWINSGDYAVEILLLKFDTIHECIMSILTFIHMSKYTIVDNLNGVMYEVKLSKSYDDIYIEFQSFIETL